MNDKNIEDIWNLLMKVRFKSGKDDAQLSLVKVMPLEDYYYYTTGKRFTIF